jgi:hypothetical protein
LLLRATSYNSPHDIPGSQTQLLSSRNVATALEQEKPKGTSPNTTKIEKLNEGGIIWSILICTLPKRFDFFEAIYHTLQNQINNEILSGRLRHSIEVLYYEDDHALTTGAKRNKLLKAARGKYVNFIDDDDMVSDDYIAMIYERLLKDPDCVALLGIITFDGQNPMTFIHSINYTSIYSGADGIFYRPPNHLNPIRRSIAQQFSYPNVSQGEDAVYTMLVANSRLLQKEESVPHAYYFYLLRTNKEGI